MAVDPVPMTPMRFPSRGTEWSQRAVWKAAPAKAFRPSMSGSEGWCRMPTAVMTASNRPWGPWLVTISQAPSRQSAD